MNYKNLAKKLQPQLQFFSLEDVVLLLTYGETEEEILIKDKINADLIKIGKEDM